jgi:hypothetical protein
MSDTPTISDIDSATAYTDSVFELLQDNYTCLHRHYRLGHFESFIPFVDKFRPEHSADGFYRLDGNEPAVNEPGKPRTISFKEAIDDLYQLTRYVSNLSSVPSGTAILLLRCKCLIYEAIDYSRDVPGELGQDLKKIAEQFPKTPPQVIQQAEKLNGKPFSGPDAKDDCVRVIKVQLIAALCGINEMYRAHNQKSCETALRILHQLRHFIDVELRSLRKEPRPSHGLSGLCNYLLGRIHAEMGAYGEARKAFRESADAYLNRIRQKEEFYKKKRLGYESYREKASVTLRRTALVTAFGGGFISLTNSEITRALESLTLARPALSQNSGLAYLNLVDVLWWACQRAIHSSEPEWLERIIENLDKCRREFERLEHPRYMHRAGIQLALAHYYRGKPSQGIDDVDFEIGMRYLQHAIDYAIAADQRIKNPSLLSEALTIKARFLRSQHRSLKATNPQLAFEKLKEAEREALKARDVSKGLRVLAAEANVALGDIHADMAQMDRKQLKQISSDFRTEFNNATNDYKRALKLNPENRRIEGLCYLRLAKLCKLDDSFELAAINYFKEWQRVEANVEHQYCKEMARELEESLKEPFLVLRPGQTFNESSDKVYRFLWDESIKNFIATNAHRFRDRKLSNPSELKNLLINHLRDELGQHERTIEGKLNEDEIARVALKLQDPSQPASKSNRESYWNRKIKETVERVVENKYAAEWNDESWTTFLSDALIENVILTKNRPTTKDKEDAKKQALTLITEKHLVERAKKLLNRWSRSRAPRVKR